MTEDYLCYSVRDTEIDIKDETMAELKKDVK
jgi:hypothetical protein